jgi:rubrerythrin
MSAPSDERPLTWKDVDREALAQLLASGLTPDQVGALFSRTGSLVRKTARAWDLDCRALRARALGLKARHPDIAEQFVHVVDGASLDLRPEDLLSGSGARCRWRCPSCKHEWVTSVANRTTRRSGCPACARGRAQEIARARPPKTRPLSKVAVDLVDEFVENLSRPDRDVTTTPSGSHDRVLWRCRVGHEWETSARQRARHSTQCPTCLAGLWTSRLEFEVAEFVQVATGLPVTVGARRARTDRASDERVDLLVPDIGLLVDVDPTRWHSADKAVAGDARKLDRLAGERYVRIRPRRLGLLPSRRADENQQVVLSGDDETDPWNWALAVLEALKRFSPEIEVRTPSPSARIEAKARADLRWRQLRSGPRARSLLSEHPEIAQQFVSTVDRPGLTQADLAPSSDDRVLWRCPDCGHEWEARVGNRTLLGTGCPPCSYLRGSARAATPRPGQSFADRHPELVEYFVENHTNPGKTLFDVKPNSIDMCTWNCRYCGQPWITKPHALNRTPTSGCRPCGSKRSAEMRRGPKQAKVSRRDAPPRR